MKVKRRDLSPQHHDNRTCAATNSHRKNHDAAILRLRNPRSAGATQLHENATKRDGHAKATNQKPAEAMEQQQHQCCQTHAPLYAA